MSFKLGNIDVNKIYIGNSEMNKAYLGTTEIFGGNVTPSPSSNLVLNGTFDNSDNISLAGNWSIVSGKLAYDNAGISQCNLDLSSNLVNGNSYTLTFDLDVVGNGKYGLFTEDTTIDNLEVQGAGLKSYTFTYEGTDTSTIGIRGFVDNEYTIDNVVLIQN